MTKCAIDSFVISTNLRYMEVRYSGITVSFGALSGVSYFAVTSLL